jgi:hypothetical protein
MLGEEMKTYLVSEELLRQVLDAVVCGASYASAVSGENDRSVKAYLDLGEALRTLLAKEPSDPDCYVETDDDGDIAWGLDVCMSDDPSWFDNPIPLYRKDM